MALRGIGFFDIRGQYFRTPDEATVSDLAAILGRIGEGEGLTQGIAKTLLEKRGDIERLFSDHDAMTVSGETGSNVTVIRKVS
jgi:hypothetical protein